MILCASMFVFDFTHIRKNRVSFNCFLVSFIFDLSVLYVVLQVMI